ncbi:MAG: trypsin-like peptidase domain-containing protein [Defluviitaleaceae bacterium]|nr:trypsin-like peptidase domain-containing protein [Defluviitaleaceae bacterium]
MLENNRNGSQKTENNPFDPYNFSEIEKIQLDIEKALSLYEPIKTFEIADMEDITITTINVDLTKTEPLPHATKTETPETIVTSVTSETPETHNIPETSTVTTEFSETTLHPKPVELPQLSEESAKMLDTLEIPSFLRTEQTEQTERVEQIEQIEQTEQPVQIEHTNRFEQIEQIEQIKQADWQEWANRADHETVLRTTIAPQEPFYTETIKTPTFSPTAVSTMPTIPAMSATAQPTKIKKRFLVTLLLLCTLGTGMLGMGIGFGIAFAQGQQATLPQTTESPQYVPSPVLGSSHLTFGNDGNGAVAEGSLADLVRLVDPAVVRISANLRPEDIAPPFANSRINLQSYDASGIIFSRDEYNVYIVTSWHVVSNAESVSVSIMESEPILARPVGRNTDIDLSVISVSVADILRAGITNVTVAAFGNSDEMQVGDIVLAIGNAMGEGNSATSGIISAVETDVVIQNRTLRLLRTDAAINLGNSGGPLINKQGEVIGINTSVPTLNTYSLEGMGFSIPASIALPIIEEIMNQAPSPFLGIRGQSVADNETVAAEFNIPPIGVYVSSVIPGTSAEIAGIRDGDIITGFNGKAILNMEQLIAEIASISVGDTIEVNILRNQAREQLTLQVILGHDSNNF